MKHFFSVPSLLLLFVLNASAQFNIASISDGSFKSPSTWNCNCIPLPVATIAVNHHVVFDTSFALVTAMGYTGKLTIATGASLLQDTNSHYLFVDGSSSIINNGKFYCDSLFVNNGRVINNDSFWVNTFANLDSISNAAGAVMLVTDSFYTTGKLFNSGKLFAPTFYNGGAITNNNIISSVDSFLNNGTFTNNVNGKIYVSTFYNQLNFSNKGKILQVESLTNNGTYLNDVGGTVNVDSMLNLSLFTNKGVMNINLIGNTGTYNNDDSTYFTDLLTTGIINNNGIFIGTHDAINSGILNLNSGSFFFLDNDFLNADSIAHDALTDIEGEFQCKNWYNVDVVQGNFGRFLVLDTTWNSGNMNQTFDICDATPPATAPFIDFNFGNISSGITYCHPVSVNEMVDNQNIKIYPTISDGLLTVKNAEGSLIEIFSTEGKMIRNIKISNNTTELNCSFLNEGIYFFKVHSSFEISAYPIVIQK